jgi:hypothetical protein
MMAAVRQDFGKRHAVAAKHHGEDRKRDGGITVARNHRRASADKMTKKQAEYQDTPNGIYSCGLCSLFEAPEGCKVVEGVVSKDGWCKAFALQD